MTGFKIHLEFDETKFSAASISSYNGVPVETVSKERSLEFLGCYNEDNFDPMPGGVEINGKGTGTSGYVVEQTKANSPHYGDEFMITAPHLWGWEDGVPVVADGEKATRHNGDLGKVQDGVGSEDWCVVDNSLSNVDWEMKVSNPETLTKYYVQGYASEARLAELKSEGTHVYKSGCAVGFDGGPVDKINVSDGARSIDFSGKGVKLKMRGARGDSGGPVFDLSGSYADLICPVSTGDNKINEYTCHGVQINSIVYGMASWSIAEDYGYHPVAY